MAKRKKKKENSSGRFIWLADAFRDGSPVDHTWVTTFDLRKNEHKSEQAIYAANELYWFCYGLLRLKGRFLASQFGERSLSGCLVEPNARSEESDPAKGAIFQYGWHGMCHQLANQVLFSTGIKGPPLTVKGARGYVQSLYLYGPYGRNVDDWENRKKRCAIQSPHGDEAEMNKDDFEERARQVLGKTRPDLLHDLMALRAEAMGDEPPANASAAVINRRNQVWFDKAAKLLGHERYAKIFEMPPGPVNLINPEIMDSRRSEGRKATQWAARVPTRHSVPGTPPTVTIKHLAAALAETHEMSKREAQTVLGDLVGNIVKHLKKGERVRIGGLGILQVRKRAARIGRNPATGELLRVKASKKVAFRASKELKESI